MKNILETAVMNIAFQRILIAELHVSYASQLSFSKVSVTNFSINALKYNVYHRCLYYILNQATWPKNQSLLK